MALGVKSSSVSAWHIYTQSVATWSNCKYLYSRKTFLIYNRMHNTVCTRILWEISREYYNGVFGVGSHIIAAGGDNSITQVWNSSCIDTSSHSSLDA